MIIIVVLLFAILGLLAIVFVPQILVKPSRSSTYESNVSVVTTRNQVRGTVAQIVAGFAFVATFVQSSSNFNQDFRQKTEQNTAELFAKAIFQIKDVDAESWSTVGAFHVLGTIAHSSPPYHQQVFDVISQYILRTGEGDCDNKRYWRSEYRMSPRMLAATRALVDRDTVSDYRARQFNLDGACFVGAQFKNAKGLSNLFMPKAYFLRADARESNFEESDLGGLNAGIDQYPEWKNAKWDALTAWEVSQILGRKRFDWIANFERARFKNSVLNGAGFKGANMKDVIFENVSMLGVDFRSADLTGAKFEGGNINWTHFNGANIARTTFKKVDGLSLEQLRAACVREIDEKGADLPVDKLQPVLPAKLQAAVKASGGILICP